MHQYMKSIGFGNIRDKKQLTQILKDVEESYTQHQLVTQDETTDLCEFEKNMEKESGSRCAEIWTSMNSLSTVIIHHISKDPV